MPSKKKEGKYLLNDSEIRKSGRPKQLTKKQIKDLEEIRDGNFLKDIFVYRKTDSLPFFDKSSGEEFFFDFTVSKDVKITQDQIKLISKAMVKYFYENDEAISFDAFVVRSGIPARALRNWIEKYDYFYEAWDFCKSIISYRRELGGLTNKYNPQIVTKSMHHYSPEYKKDREDNLQVGETESNIKLVLPDYFGGKSKNVDDETIKKIEGNDE